MIDTQKEANEFFHHNPSDKKIYFCMVMENELEEIQDTIYDLCILEEIDNENIQEKK